MVQSHSMLQCSGVKCSLKVQWILRKIILTWNVWWLLIVDDILEIQSSYYSTLGMVNRGWWNDDVRGIQKSELQGRNSWKTTSTQERRGLWISQMIDLGDVKIDCHHISASKVPIQPTADCTWIWMDVWQIREKARRDYCIGPGSSIILFVQPFPQYSIKVGYGCGWGDSVE